MCLKQHVEIKLTPVTTTTVGQYTARTHQEGWSGKVTGAEDIRNHIRDQVGEVIRKFTRHLESSLTAEVVLEDGTKLDIPIGVNLKGTYRPEITDNSMKVAVGEEIPIKFGSGLHNTLHGISNDRRLEATKSAISLRALGLVNNWSGSVTSKGLGVLKQLDQLGPPTNKRGLLLVARELLNAEYGVNDVTRDYLITHEFIKYDLSTRCAYVCTDKGTQWLQTYAHRIYNYKLLPGIGREELVLFMSKDQLAEALTSPIDDIRIQATRRMRELGEELPPDIDTTTLAVDNTMMIKKIWREMGFE